MTPTSEEKDKEKKEEEREKFEANKKRQN